MTTAPTLRAAILRECLEDPASDEPRLIYADLCEDEGDHALAEFVRASMRLADPKRPSKHDDLIDLRLALIELEHDNPISCYHLSTPVQFENAPITLSRDLLCYWRGFAEVWAVQDVPTFEREAAGVFARHPIRRVVLRCEVTRTIGETGSRYDHPHDCSRPLCLLLSGEEEQGNPQFDTPFRYYPAEALARADLEACLVKHGRTLANLPPLTQPQGATP